MNVPFDGPMRNPKNLADLSGHFPHAIHSTSPTCRVLRLTHPAPDIVEAILVGRQPRALELQSLLKPLPVQWGAQRKVLGFAVAH